jgi:hypothetical protein
MGCDSFSKKLQEQPNFEALAEVAKGGLLAAETWQSNRAHISLKTIIDVPLLGTVIKQNGDGLLALPNASWMATPPNGAVKQRCVHRTTTLQELDDLLSACDMKRDLVELGTQSGREPRCMEPSGGCTLCELWADLASDISVISLREITTNEI